MKTAQTTVVNGIRITPEIIDVLTQWFGFYEETRREGKNLEYLVETRPHSYIQALIKAQDIMIDRLEQTYPNISTDLFDVLSYLKQIRLDFEHILPKRKVEDEN